MTHQTYTVLLRMYEDNWTPKFAFTANNYSEAQSKVIGWTAYHGFSQNDTTFRIATANEAANWLHNEYVK